MHKFQSSARLWKDSLRRIECVVLWCGVGSGNAIPNLQFNILQTCFEFIFELFFDAHSSCNGITLTHNNIMQIPFKWLENCLEHLTKFREWSFQRKCVQKKWLTIDGMVRKMTHCYQLSDIILSYLDIWIAQLRILIFGNISVWTISFKMFLFSQPNTNNNDSSVLTMSTPSPKTEKEELN